MPWTIVVPDAQVLAIHAALLPLAGGKVLYFGGDQHSPDELAAGHVDNARVHDLSSGTLTPAPGVTTDLFCCGHAFLPDGRLMVGGGTSAFDDAHDQHLGYSHFRGERATWIYAAHPNAWHRAADFRPQPGFEAANTGGGRWYPSLVTLANGTVLAVSGHPVQSDTRHDNDSPEVYLGTSDSWSLVGGATTDSNYFPRLFVLPDGRVFWATPVNGSTCRIYDPVAGTFSGGITPPTDGFYGGFGCSGVLLPLLPGDGYRARVLLTGGIQPVRIDLSVASPAWQPTSARQGSAAGKGRTHGHATLLPTGEVFVSGGIDPDTANNNATPDSRATLAAELYDAGIDWGAGTYAGTEAWATTDAAAVVRNYHPTALLLPDGRVWTAGSDHDGGRGLANRELEIELWAAPWFSDPARPVITAAPESVAYGGAFVVRTPQAGAIARVALIRSGSCTHAFNFDQRYVGCLFAQDGASDRLLVQAPPNSGIAPPGHYMLWIVDSAGRPCQLASFVRVCDQRSFVVTDRSTFSKDEVEAQLPPYATATAAPFPRALYVIYEGFLPGELGTPPGVPSARFTWDNASGNLVSGMSVTLRELKAEDPTQPADVAQRFTYVFDLQFADPAIFASVGALRSVNVRFTLGAQRCDARLDLVTQPNPYMRDGDPSWLSIDTRVFQVRAGQTRLGVPMATGAGDPLGYIAGVLTAFNGTPTDEFHPFNDLTPDEVASALELSREVNGERVFNFAVAKVRYRSATVSAADVRLFFRIFRVVGTVFEYDTARGYRRAGSGPTAVPLLGLQGTEILTIPCFAAARVTPGQAMTTQTDPLNQRTLAPSTVHAGDESYGYFGCWLDFNQTDAQIPLLPADDGPYPVAQALPIQALMRGDHCCLVTEIHFKPSAAAPELIPPAATPGSSDKLSQRNLALVRSGNPGSATTRTVQHPLELRGSQASLRGLELPRIVGLPPTAAGLGASHVRGPTQAPLPPQPDELMIFRNDLPRAATATLFLPDVDLDAVQRLAARRQGPARLRRVDAHTLSFALADATFIPLPGDRLTTIAGLLAVVLPPGVVKGQRFHLTAHQFSGVTRRVIGSFQLTIPVEEEGAILPLEQRRLSVLRSIERTIPSGDRWREIFARYLGQVADRVRGFGGDASLVTPSPDGDGFPGADGGRGGRPGDDAGGGRGGVPGGATVRCGKVLRLVYDGAGDFRGVVLHRCPGEHFLASCEPAVERVAREALERRWSLCATLDPKDRHCILRLEIGLEC